MKTKAAMIVCLFCALSVASSPRARAADDLAEGYALNMYHFNIQYVVGSEASMRRIIVESFEPLVEFYIEHPQWGADFEMQGLMIQYMADNFPEVLDKFRSIINSGQCELVTFHYSDSLLIAFPAHDQEWSIKLNDRILEENDIKRSGVIFCQEAQFSEGMTYLGKDRGYEIGVMTTSEYRWFRDDQRYPYFTLGGMEVITNKHSAEPSTGIKVKWTFSGDGELVATAGISPYFPGLFKENKLKLRRLEKQFMDLEGQGYKIATVTEYVNRLRSENVEPQPLGPILDSPWRPNDGSGVLQWMGRYSLPWEKDYHMRTMNWRVREKLIEAERGGASDYALDEAWGCMLNAEVSDPTGWYPFPVEINWDYEMMQCVAGAIGADYENLENWQSQTFAEGADLPREAAPLSVELRGRAKKADLQWRHYPDRPGLFGLKVAWSGKGDGSVGFAWPADKVIYSPAMMEHTLKEIPKRDLLGNTIHLGLPNGLIWLGGGKYLVRENAAGCVGAGLYFEDSEVRFDIEKGREKNYEFIFYILDGWSSDQALEFANRLNNVRP